MISPSALLKWESQYRNYVLSGFQYQRANQKAAVPTTMSSAVLVAGSSKKWPSLSPAMVLQILSEVLSTLETWGSHTLLWNILHMSPGTSSPHLSHTRGPCHLLNALRERHSSNPTSEKCFSLWPREERGGGQASLGCWIKNIFRAWSFPTAWKQEVPNPREQ